jgi:hypothetical protein
MGYDLQPKNEDAGDFHFGAFSWCPLIEACGYLWPLTSSAGRWYCVWGADPRMPEGDKYPRVLSNDGFEVTAEEAKIMARIARNFVAVQRSLPEANQDKSLMGKKEIRKPDVEAALIAAMHGRPANEEWPVKIRTDFVDRYERFADWAEKSGGFAIH